MINHLMKVKQRLHLGQFLFRYPATARYLHLFLMIVKGVALTLHIAFTVILTGMGTRARSPQHPSIQDTLPQAGVGGGGVPFDMVMPR